MVQLQKYQASFFSSGIQIRAVILGSPEDSQKVKERAQTEIDIIADQDGSFIDQLGLRDNQGNPFTGEDVARPAKVLVSSSGKLLWFYYSENYRVRTKPKELLRIATKALSAK